MGLVADLDPSEPRSDGRRAWTHLAQTGFQHADQADGLARFKHWRAGLGGILRLRGLLPELCCAPAWAR